MALMAGIAFLLLIGSARVARAQSGLRYVFDLTKLELPEEASQREPLLRHMVHKAISAHPELLPALPDDCPSPTDAPAHFRKYLEKHNLRAYRINVKLTTYEHSVEPNPKKSGQILATDIALHFLGEEIHPERVMAFTGEGSSNVRVEVGKKIRDRDWRYADQEAFDLAIKDAIAASLKKLAAEPPPKVEAVKKRQPRKTRRKKKRAPTK